MISSRSCADPESFFRGGPTLTGLLGEGGSRYHTISGPSSARKRNAIKMMAFHWRAADGPTLNADLVAL